MSKKTKETNKTALHKLKELILSSKEDIKHSTSMYIWRRPPNNRKEEIQGWNAYFWKALNVEAARMYFSDYDYTHGYFAKFINHLAFAHLKKMGYFDNEGNPNRENMDKFTKEVLEKIDSAENQK